MNGRSVTVSVPPALYSHLLRRAQERQRSIEDEVLLTLAAAVPTDEGPLPDEMATAALAVLDDDALWRLARSRVADDDAARLAELADKRQRTGLTDDELAEAEELVQRHDRVIVVRAEAAALLKERGHDVSGLLAGA